MRIENTLVEKLKSKEPDTVYTYSIHYVTKSKSGLIEYDHYYERTPYSTYEAVINAIEEESKEDDSYFDWCSRKFRVQKRWLDSKSEFNADVTASGEVCDAFRACPEGLLPETDRELFGILDLIDIYIPVPFKKGDILTYGDGWIPFVLTEDNWKYGKKKYPDEQRFRAHGTIMDSIYSYSVRENGHIYWDFNPAQIDIQYYRHSLTGLNKILLAISNHIKGNIPVDLMMNACNIILNEEQCKSLRRDMHYTEKGLALVGFSDSINDNEKEESSDEG